MLSNKWIPFLNIFLMYCNFSWIFKQAQFTVNQPKSCPTTHFTPHTSSQNKPNGVEKLPNLANCHPLPLAIASGMITDICNIILPSHISNLRYLQSKVISRYIYNLIKDIYNWIMTIHNSSSRYLQGDRDQSNLNLTYLK